jgi:hypothetical protein
MGLDMKARQSRVEILMNAGAGLPAPLSGGSWTSVYTSTAKTAWGAVTGCIRQARGDGWDTSGMRARGYNRRVRDDGELVTARLCLQG